MGHSSGAALPGAQRRGGLGLLRAPEQLNLGICHVCAIAFGWDCISAGLHFVSFANVLRVPKDTENYLYYLCFGKRELF
jgi:hypothetical protein